MIEQTSPDLQSPQPRTGKASHRKNLTCIKRREFGQEMGHPTVRRNVYAGGCGKRSPLIEGE
jgi:hypothetical protein